MYIFIDESGDLGHHALDNPKKSKYFVLVGLCCKNPEKIAKMKAGALSFAKTDAAYKIAEQVVDIALSHESR